MCSGKKETVVMRIEGERNAEIPSAVLTSQRCCMLAQSPEVQASGGPDLSSCSLWFLHVTRTPDITRQIWFFLVADGRRGRII